MSCCKRSRRRGSWKKKRSMAKIPPITIKTEDDGEKTYYIPEGGGVEIYDTETGELIMYLSRSPAYVYPLLQVLAERCPDLIDKVPEFAKFRKTYEERLLASKNKQ